MRRRPAARLLILDAAGRLLLFHFVHKTGALAGQAYWATPGGAVEEGETFEQAAIRELAEETGIRRDNVGSEVGRREFVLQLPDGEHVLAEERFFLVEARTEIPSREGCLADEAEIIAEHRWWSAEDLARTSETVWPDNLAALRNAAISRSVR
jgi:8-oxo-dGTP pyrophosphatase MutT (NUDIX family)